MKIRHLAWILMVSMFYGRSTCLQASEPPSSSSSIQVSWGTQIELRDGTYLNAVVYAPKTQHDPTPCLLTVTPYVADTYHERGVYFASHGFPFVIVNARGRGGSGGRFRPFIQEANDGYDVVEWLARQPYCNGRIGMWGGSYAGYDQWVTAKGLPPHLRTIVPAASPYLGLDFPMRNNIFFPYIVQWLTYVSGSASQTKLFNDDALWSSWYRDWLDSGASFANVAALVGSPSPIFTEWLAHPHPDEYWDGYNPSDEEYARLQIPILTITGSYDDDQPGALEHYRRHMEHATPDARARHYLIIGPWDHAGTRTPAAEVGGLRFGSASLLDLPHLHLEWYAWTMQGGPKPAFLEKPVVYYVTGADKWRYAESLQSITVKRIAYHLDSNCNPTDVFSSGALQSAIGEGKSDSYQNDPRESHSAEAEAEARVDASSLVDQTLTLALRGKELIYQSEPFSEDLEVSGFFKLTAWIAINRPDTDLYVSVYDLGLNGEAVRLSTDAIRARYRTGSRTPKLIRTSKPLRYDFDHFTFISREIQKGHRLRLVVAPMGRLIQTTFAERNFNAGGEVARESVKDGLPVTVTLYHDRDHPSALYVPKGQPFKGAEESSAPRP